ncbi:hypothetical protein [Flaviaesturariibacter terrae]
MKQKIFNALAGCLLLACPAHSQQPSSISFADWYAQSPVPMADIDETYGAFGSMDGTERRFRASYEKFHEPLEELLKSFHERFREGLASPARLSPEERRLAERYRQAGNGLREDGLLSVFALLMEDRPLASAKQLSWDKPAGLSAQAQEWYRALLDIERSLDWPALSADVKKEGPLAVYSHRDEEAEAMNAAFQRQVAALPMKKVKVAPGSDVTTEVSDPEKMAQLLANLQKQRRVLWKKQYTQRYAWWKLRYDRVQAAALRLDSLLEATGFGGSLEGADASLRPVLADVQLRILQSLSLLHGMTAHLVDLSRMLGVSEVENRESIATYEKLARGEGMLP